MLGAIKRVISGDDVKDGESQDNAPLTDIDTPAATFQAPPALIENDQDMEIEADVTITNIESVLQTPGSSLSDVSAAPDIQQLEMNGGDQVLPPRPISRGTSAQAVLSLEQAHLPRNDSKSIDSSSLRGSSQNSSRDWGWFEDASAEMTLTPHLKRKDTSEDKSNKKKGKTGGRLVPMDSDGSPETIRNNPVNEAAAMAVTAPTYVLEESLSSQKLWKNTAGNRPPQPVEERAFFEKMWAQNFKRSQVEYQMPVEVLTASTPISLSPFADGNFDTARGNEISNYNLGTPENPENQDVAEAALMSRLNYPRPGHSASVEPHQHQHISLTRTVKGTGSDGELGVLVKGDNVFGTTVSKSFARNSETGGTRVGVDTVNISIASYRVVESQKHGKYAQFLVIYREGSIRDTIGVWKRYSDFQQLSKKVTQAHEGCAAMIANMSPLAITEEHEVEHLPNAITSWRLLKKRQRWYRCLDAGYLSLKVFLLERFLHDILFESSSPNLLRDFVGTEPFR